MVKLAKEEAMLTNQDPFEWNITDLAPIDLKDRLKLTDLFDFRDKALDDEDVREEASVEQEEEIEVEDVDEEIRLIGMRNMKE